MRVLITGKNGQVGNSLVEQFLKMSGVTFLALDRSQLDISNNKQVNAIVHEFHPTVIINAAAYTAVDKAETESELAKSVNYNGAKNLAEAACEVGAVIIHISTDYVFSGNKSGLYSEADKVNPQGVYGQTKLEGEQAVALACPAHIILRTAWVFSEHGNNFVKTMLRLGLTRDTLGVVADQFGGPTYAGDIAKAIITIALAIGSGSRAYGIYHYSGAPHVSWQQFAVEIFKVAKEQSVLNSLITVNTIDTESYPTPAKRPANSTLDCSKIKNVFSIQPSDWRLALKNIHQYQ